jgi:Lrp/AsnC family transcriptional regulator for asnA, asnC and gidA
VNNRLIFLYFTSHMFISLPLSKGFRGGYMIDETDRKIIHVLQKDGRASLRKISEEVGVALGTVSNRVNRMESSGIITGYSVRLDPEKVGWSLNVVIGLRIEKGRLIEIQEKISRDYRVCGVYDVTGDYDSMVIARAKDREDLDDLIKNVMSVDGIERSLTQLVLNTVKETVTVAPE